MLIEQHLPIRPFDQHKESQRLQPQKMPQELFPWPHWVCWRYVERGQGRKPDKQPVNPRTLHNAGVHWPNTWSRFEVAHQTYLTYRYRGIQGLGFVLTLDDPYVAIDLDGCVDEARVDEQATSVITA